MKALLGSLALLALGAVGVTLLWWGVKLMTLDLARTWAEQQRAVAGPCTCGCRHPIKFASDK